MSFVSAWIRCHRSLRCLRGCRPREAPHAPSAAESWPRSRFFFPVTQKNYNSDPAIAGHWRTLERALKQAWAFTIFGYNAPKTDVEAVDLMKEGWGEPNNRSLEEIEIIDIRDEEALRSSWDEFIHTHHYRTITSFYDSYVGRHPRRSCEALRSQLMDSMFIVPFPIPRDAEFEKLYEWLQPRINAENKSRDNK